LLGIALGIAHLAAPPPVHQNFAIKAKLTRSAALSRLLPDRPHLPSKGDTTLPGSRLALSVSPTLDDGKAIDGKIMAGKAMRHFLE
jgi:hypothetical protein